MITIITVGKVKNSAHHALSEEYLMRLRKTRVYEIKHISWKDMGDAKLTNKILEYKQKHSSRKILLLDEAGRLNNTKQFLQYIESFDTAITFIIAGAFGFPKHIKEEFQNHISLSPLTFTHEMAFVLLVEQLYRIASLKAGLPYHKE